MTAQNNTKSHTESTATKTPIVIPPSAFTTLPGPPNAPFVRKQCFDDGHLWMGVVTTEVGATSPWHHHGEYDTLVYALEGEGTIEFGDEGRESMTFKADGSVVIVPKGLIHREINTGTVKNKAVVIRIGEGQSVIPVAM